VGCYDCRCSLTGLSLKASEAYAVLLEKRASVYVPSSFPIKGCYNRYGSIDFIEEDDNTDAILNYMTSSLQNENVSVVWDEFQFRQFDTIEQVLQATERSTTQEYDCITVNGNRLTHSLICADIWDYLVAHFPRSSDNTDILQRSTFASEMYKDQIARNWSSIRIVSDFMESANIAWTVPFDFTQHFSEEMNLFVDEAQERFKNFPIVNNAISQYKVNVSEFLEHGY
jgi:hypothetical protein